MPGGRDREQDDEIKFYQIAPDPPDLPEARSERSARGLRAQPPLARIRGDTQNPERSALVPNAPTHRTKKYSDDRHQSSKASVCRTASLSVACPRAMRSWSAALALRTSRMKPSGPHAAQPSASEQRARRRTSDEERAGHVVKRRVDDRGQVGPIVRDVGHAVLVTVEHGVVREVDVNVDAALIGKLLDVEQARHEFCSHQR